MVRRSIILFTAFLGFSCSERPSVTTSSPEARNAYFEGMRLFENFYYVEAQKAFERALELDSTFAMASGRLAVLHARSEDEQAAKREIARALRLASGASTREQMFIRLFDHSIHFRNNEAKLVADSLIDQYPDVPEVYVWRGNYFEWNKDFDAALDMYKRAVDVDTGYAPAVMSLGYAYSARGEFDKAISEMERYIRLAPAAADPRASFADILLRSGRYDEALEQYRKSLELKPDYWYAINRIGDIYATLGRLDEADEQFNLGLGKMMLNNQIRASHLATQASLQYRRGNYGETVRLCDQSLALDSTNMRGAFIRVLALLRLKELREADQYIGFIRGEIERKNLAESQVMLDYFLLRARFFVEQGLFDEAEAVCDSAMEHGSELSRREVYLVLAETYLKRAEYDAALGALEEALRYNPNSPQALLTLAKVYAAAGDNRMMHEIGGRLLQLWDKADPDFQSLIELKKLLKTPAASSSPVS